MNNNMTLFDLWGEDFANIPAFSTESKSDKKKESGKKVSKQSKKEDPVVKKGEIIFSPIGNEERTISIEKDCSIKECKEQLALLYEEFKTDVISVEIIDNKLVPSYNQNGTFISLPNKEDEINDELVQKLKDVQVISLFDKQINIDMENLGEVIAIASGYKTNKFYVHNQYLFPIFLDKKKEIALEGKSYKYSLFSTTTTKKVVDEKKEHLKKIISLPVTVILATEQSGKLEITEDMVGKKEVLADDVKNFLVQKYETFRIGEPQIIYEPTTHIVHAYVSLKTKG